MDYSNKQNSPLVSAPARPIPKRELDSSPDLEDLFAVVMLNDDKTPMRFVVETLQKLFRFNRREAIALMLTVHNEGRGVCGAYSEEIACSKAEELMREARRHNHPLRCITERIDD